MKTRIFAFSIVSLLTPLSAFASEKHPASFLNLGCSQFSGQWVGLCRIQEGEATAKTEQQVFVIKQDSCDSFTINDEALQIGVANEKTTSENGAVTTEKNTLNWADKSQTTLTSDLTQHTEMYLPNYTIVQDVAGRNTLKIENGALISTAEYMLKIKNGGETPEETKFTADCTLSKQ